MFLVPVTLMGLMPTPESSRMLRPIFLFKKSKTFAASGVPSRHSMPA